jgi:radical SAM superfamily enzyme YgiQ (UPF0313 family)
MPSRVLLISANRCSVPEKVFPLALTYLQAALRREGHVCRWLDLLEQPERLEEALRGFQPEVVAISVRNIDDVVIRKRETFFDDLPGVCAAIRRLAGSRIVVGGSGFSIFPEPLLRLSGADFGIAGEGEESLARLVRCLEQGGGYEDIPGLVYRRGETIQVNPPENRPFAVAVGEEDRPAEVADAYLKSCGVLNVQTQRGCACRCCYCTYPVIEGRAHRRRPPEQVAEEFARIVARKARYAFIVDSVFNSSARHVEEICEAILRRGIKLSWGCFLRPQGLTPELMKLMARAGLSHVEFGSDSFCDEVLAAYGKGFSFEEVRRSTELAMAEQVDCCHFLIAGGPGETEATLQRSFDNSASLGRSTILAVVGMRIYPGTALHQRALAEGVVAPEDDLLAPRYYVAPGLDSDRVFERLRDQARRSPGWVAGDPVPAYTRLVERLRQRGVVGPLWSYFSVIQRLWPQAGGEAPQP